MNLEVTSVTIIGVPLIGRITKIELNGPFRVEFYLSDPIEIDVGDKAEARLKENFVEITFDKNIGTSQTDLILTHKSLITNNMIMVFSEEVPLPVPLPKMVIPVPRVVFAFPLDMNPFSASVGDRATLRISEKRVEISAN